jgi:hypothetical protein
VVEGKYLPFSSLSRSSQQIKSTHPLIHPSFTIHPSSSIHSLIHPSLIRHPSIIHPSLIHHPSLIRHPYLSLITTIPACITHLSIHHYLLFTRCYALPHELCPIHSLWTTMMHHGNFLDSKFMMHFQPRSWSGNHISTPIVWTGIAKETDLLDAEVEKLQGHGHRARVQNVLYNKECIESFKSTNSLFYLFYVVSIFCVFFFFFK